MRNRKEGCWTTFWSLTRILGSKIPLHPNQSKKNSCKFILQSFSAHFALASYSMVSVQEGSRCTVWSLAFNCFYLQLFTNPSDGRYLREREKVSRSPVSHWVFSAFVYIEKHEKHYPCLSIMFGASPHGYSIFCNLPIAFSSCVAPSKHQMESQKIFFNDWW